MYSNPASRGGAADSIPAVAGIGLRFPHHDIALSGDADARWFEVHPENYLGRGVAGEILMQVREHYPLSLHATGLSLGSADGVDADHLAAIADLCARVQPGLVSDHLSWSAAGSVHVPDLLPLPYTGEALDVFVRNIDRVQSALGRSILIENPSVYLAFADSEMEESEFLGALVRRSGCGMLLDVNNVAVTASNLGGDAVQRLNAILSCVPADSIGEIHLAGHAVKTLPDGTRLCIDDHGSPVSGEVWDLFSTVVRRIGARPALIEWDTDIPAFEILAREAAMADTAMVCRAEKELVHAAAG
ncbi:MAG TPA: DUF692 domain-containing protein [Rhizomicrobium sp.]|jgi:hypothetical protein|nr:DUF692 domain-containing protein [Rhizomicrobium sp.]